MEELQRVLSEKEVTAEELLNWLKSDSVYWTLRTAYKSPTKCGLDEIDDRGVYDLYYLVESLRK
jgi:hypothetical protein